MEIRRQPLIFSNNDHRCALLGQSAERQYLETRDEVPFIRALVTMDAPEHSVYRRLTFKKFTPKGIRGLEESIRALAVESIDEMAAQGSSCDLDRKSVVEGKSVSVRVDLGVRRLIKIKK